MNSNEKLLTVAELARRLDVGEDKVRAMAKRGEIPSVKVGNGRRFVWADVLAALQRSANAEREAGGS